MKSCRPIEVGDELDRAAGQPEVEDPQRVAPTPVEHEPDRFSEYAGKPRHREPLRSRGFSHVTHRTLARPAVVRPPKRPDGRKRVGGRERTGDRRKRIGYHDAVVRSTLSWLTPRMACPRPGAGSVPRPHARGRGRPEAFTTRCHGTRAAVMRHHRADLARAAPAQPLGDRAIGHHPAGRDLLHEIEYGLDIVFDDPRAVPYVSPRYGIGRAASSQAGQNGRMPQQGMRAEVTGSPGRRQDRFFVADDGRRRPRPCPSERAGRGAVRLRHRWTRGGPRLLWCNRGRPGAAGAAGTARATSPPSRLPRASARGC